MPSELSPNDLDRISSSLDIASDVEELFNHIGAQAERIDQLEADLQGATARVAELEDQLEIVIADLANLEGA